MSYIITMKIIAADWLFKKNRWTGFTAVAFAKAVTKINFVRHGSIYNTEKRRCQVKKQKKIKKNLD